VAVLRASAYFDVSLESFFRVIFVVYASVVELMDVVLRHLGVSWLLYQPAKVSESDWNRCWAFD
jgi:hypothetical protein